MTLSILISLALQAVRNPREAASTVLSLGVPRAALVPALALTVVLSVMLTALGQALAPQSGLAEVQVLPPVLVALVLSLVLAGYIIGLYKGGRALGGSGSLAETVLLITFLQFVLLLAQAVEVLLWVVAPPLAGVFVLAVAILAFWINVNFIDVLHGYGSLLKSFGLILMVSLGLALAFVVLLSLAGVSIQGGA